MSSLFGSGLFNADLAWDGELSTIAHSGSAASSDQWLSIQLPTGSSVGQVDVYNSNADPTRRCWLFPFEVWLGSTPGGQTHDCGGGPITNPTCTNALGPFAVNCGGRSDLSYVTIVIRAGTWRLLTIGEVKVFSA